MSAERLVEKQTQYGWKRTTAKRLKVDDKFRMLDNDNQPIEGVFVVTRTPVVNQDGTWGLEAVYDDTTI